MAKHENMDLDLSDGKLESAAQVRIRQIVKEMPEDSISMAWRSSLNQQLRLVAAQEKRKRQVWWVVRPALGLSLATALAVVLIFQPSSKTSHVAADYGLETAIITDHHDSALLNDISSAGLNPSETIADANTTEVDDGNWTESDVQSL